MSFEENFESDKKEHHIQSNDWFKFKEGDNKMRILFEPKIIVEKFKVGIYYEDCGYDEKFPKSSKSIRYLTWIIDRADGKLKLFKMPYKVTKQLVGYKRNEEYAFEDFPMPYDVNIQAEGAGDKTVVYNLICSRKETPLTVEEEAEFGKCTIPESIIAKMKAKQMQKDGKAPVDAGDGKAEYPEEEIDAESIPF